MLSCLSNSNFESQAQTPRDIYESDTPKVCEKQIASCGLKRSRVAIQEATAPDLKTMRSRSHRVDQSEVSDLVFMAPATGPDQVASALSGNSDSVINKFKPQPNALAFHGVHGTKGSRSLTVEAVEVDCKAIGFSKARSFDIDKRNMETVEKHFKSDKSTKLLELNSFDDNFQARIRTSTDPCSLHQNEARYLRQRRRSGSSDNIEATDLLPVSSDNACLGYAEMTISSFTKMVELVHKVLGSNLPAFYLDIGSGTTAHCVISASASGRFLVCDGIEISSTRFQKSQQSLSTAKHLGFLKSECRIIEGDVLTSTDIQLQEYNVYSFFDKVCIGVSQKTIQKVIMQHSSNTFARGPILYFTCMTSSQLKDALNEVQKKLDPKVWSRLIIDESESIIASTRFASQHFKCTMVHVRVRERVKDDALAFQGVQGTKRSRNFIDEAVEDDCKAIVRHSPCIGKSEFSTLVFTPLSDAIKVWEDAGDAKARNALPEFNMLATVSNWCEPKKTKGVNL